ncbi:MAG: C39 family peptidase [Ruminococcus sp.]|uniref:cysteine peptidase family C39 domain-containing protein n=1 Tax=Ruminococcus sp. TaxID=41978 RepID=UPI00386ECFDE|nr:C39 family peptidase [Ruminococcus sp.]MBQ4239044.1 C39 family peptidase [Ruminococcus sp.]
MKKRTLVGLICVAVLTVTAVVLLPTVYTSPAVADGNDPPAVCFINEDDNEIAAQEDQQCAAYAAAYVMRHFGEEVSGSDLAPQIERVFGFVSPSCTVKLFKDHGYEAKAYHGDILTLKQAVAEGTPVVVFIRIPHDTHYAAVTGYDEEFIYLADSMTENTNADELSYNRKVRIEEFEKLWKTGTLTANNVYITVKERR